MKRSSVHVLGVVVIAAFLGLGYGEWQRTATTYVSFQEAKRSRAIVQVKGELLKDRIAYDKESGELVLHIRDKSGQEMKVTYGGPKPANLEQASHVVAIGCYRAGSFRADRLLVKCPSKYQGQLQQSGSRRLE